MISIESPLQVLLIAASVYVPEGLHVRVLFTEDKIDGEVMEVAIEDVQTRVVLLWVDRTMPEILVSMTEGIAIALTGDTDRGVAYCRMRDLLRKAHNELIGGDDGSEDAPSNVIQLADMRASDGSD